jgi:hypothetical protein
VPKYRTYLGCMGETSYKEDENTINNFEEKEISTHLIRRTDEKWIRLPKIRNDYKRDDYPRITPTFKNQRSFNKYEGKYIRVDRDQLRHEPRWNTPQKRSLTPRYQNFFLGHCYTCRNFSHKAINFRFNERNNYGRYIAGVNSRYGNVWGFVNINYNPVHPLMDQNIVCYKCNNLSHKE